MHAVCLWNSAHQSIQSINWPANKPNSWSIHLSIHPCMHQSVSPSISRSMSMIRRLLNPLSKQSTNQSAKQWTNQSANQPIIQSSTPPIPCCRICQWSLAHNSCVDHPIDGRNFEEIESLVFRFSCIFAVDPNVVWCLPSIFFAGHTHITIYIYR